MPNFDLPYFDQILELINRMPDSELAAAFERHVHWGFYAEPEVADDSLVGYVAAAEEMTRRICRAGRVRDGLRILDVGCGFGGTIHHLNEHLSDSAFTGLNIDGRQLARARRLVPPRPSNTIELVEGDACSLPFGDASFDVVLAVECAFHFPSRKQFFREARRVLAPGGTIALSDFLGGEAGLAELGAWMRSGELPESDFYGPNRKPLSAAAYQRLARGCGFAPLVDHDITANTLPTYPAMRRLYHEAALPEGEEATDYLEAMARRDFVEYHILAFETADHARIDLRHAASAGGAEDADPAPAAVV